jgi:hypothetical protein
MTTTTAAIGSPTDIKLFTDTLQHLQTTPRDLVHRSAVNEVFLTDSCAAGVNRYAVAAQLPRGHELYSDRSAPRHDPMLLVEVCRQASILVAHRYLGVPPGWMFVIRKANLATFSPELFAVGAGPANIVIDLRIDRTFMTGEFLTGALVTYTSIVDGKVASNAQGSFSCMPRDFYENLRAEGIARKPEPAPDRDSGYDHVSPEEVGRVNHKNVVIGRTVDQDYPIRVKTSHPSLFDHEVDHVSGVVLNEACRQAALVHLATISDIDDEPFDLARAEMVSFDAKFTDFTELGTTPFCRVIGTSIHEDAKTGYRTVNFEMSIIQFDKQVAEITLALLVM